LSESDLNNVLSGAFVSGDNTGSYGPQCVGGGLQIVFLMVDRRQGRAYTDLAIFDAGTVRMKIAGLLRGR
jgi:hypothetical protein